VSTITIQPGPRNAYTDAATGLRFYRWRGVDYPSVTTIRRMAGLPFRLHQWAISKVVNRAIEQHDVLESMLWRERKPREHKDEATRRRKYAREAARWLRAAATEERDLKAARGTAIHDAATSGRMMSEVPVELRPSLHQFLNWLEDSGAEIIAVEQQVFNLTLGYAGTFDILCRMPDGSIWIVDLKTGNATYVDHVLQQIGYAMGEFVGKDDVVDEDLTAVLRSAHGMALLHLTDEGWHWQPIKVTPKMFKAFTGLLDYAVFAHENQTMDDLVIDEEEGHA
jgi:hypothetical protein